MNPNKEILELKKIIDGNCKIVLALFREIQLLRDDNKILTKAYKDYIVTGRFNADDIPELREVIQRCIRKTYIGSDHIKMVVKRLNS